MTEPYNGMKEYQRNYQREWARKHPKNPIKHRLISREWRKNHPEIIIAQNLAVRHIPLGKSCQFGGCNSIVNLQRAHMDYDYPLEILTFCVKHHFLIDRIYRED
jgi:hypothetical protein